MEKFTILKDTKKKINRFNLQEHTIEFKIKPIPEKEEPIGWVRGAINQIIQKGTEGLQPGDQVGFSFCSKRFKRSDGWVRFQPAEGISHDDIWNMLAGVYQSHSTGLDTSTFCLEVTTVRMPVGKGKDRARRYNTFMEECSKRRGIITIDNKDNMCLPRALVVAIAYVNKDPDKSKIRQNVAKMQTQRAVKLLADSGVVVPEEGCGIPELQQFQQHLQNYKIVVYNYGTKGRDTIFKGSAEGPSLNLLYHEGHFNVITSLTAAFTCGYFCEKCHVPYNNKKGHKCEGTCPGCYQSPACPQVLKVTCDICKRQFRGQNCYDNHRRVRSLGKSTVCGQITRCQTCYKVVKSSRQHTCGEIFCKICNTHVPSDHLCYIQPDTRKPKTTDTLFVFYDLETGNHKHEPNLCVLVNRCDKCIGESSLYFCQKCGYRQIVYRNNVISNFMEYILTARQKFKQMVILAHNVQSFNGQFVLKYIVEKTDLKPELIMRGTKIISMKVGNVKFLDFLNYFPIPLSQLPKTFGLGNSLKRGYFPHLFKTEENKNYVGPLPAIEFYDPDNMEKGDREVFLKWHAEHNQDEFNMKCDLVEYCRSDVEILTEVCLKFRQQLLDTGNVCPFTEACTIASACNKVFRRNFLKPNTIGIIPKGSYRWRDNQSKIAVQWLVWEEHQRQINILHAAKQQELVVSGVKVDGFSPKSNQIFEFHGCYFHGCPICFKYNRDKPLCDDPNENLNTRYEATIAKSKRLRDLGHEVLEKWECEFRQELNEEIKNVTEDHPLVVSIPLNPRDAFFGGRTGNTFNYYKCKPGETIKYVRVCSLYPWVCKYGKFPIGHPQVYVGKDCDQLNLQTIDGVIKCKILPPQDLHHPVLPMKMNDKLMFVLCRTCGLTINQSDCNHSLEERAFIGTWITDEIIKAVEKGYEILEVHEIWSYQIDQFDTIKKVGGLFRGMMDTFLKIKQQAAGWPGNCITEAQRNKYIDEFLEREDMKLDFDKILENPGLTSLANFIMNSFWGKLGQRDNRPNTSIVRNPEEFFNMLANPRVYVNGVLPINEDTLIMNYEFREEAAGTLTTVNIVIAAYITTQARLKLYSYLEKLEDRVLYYDKDSVIYVSRPGEFELPTGEFIGDMTDELETNGPGSYITEYVSGGPKNYAYKVLSTRDNEEKVVCRVKGISLNYPASQLVNFESIKDMVLAPSEPIYITSKNIQRTKEQEVVTRSDTKIYTPTKRKFSEDYSSVPYGYKKGKT